MGNKYEILANYCNEGKILDVGFAQNPNPYLNNCEGLDVVKVKKKPSNYDKIFVVNLNADKIPQKSSYYDNVILGDVIEHVENPSFLLREVNRVLKSNGLIIICTPHANDWWTILHNWFFRSIIQDSDKGEHLSNWTILDMHRLLKKNGFEILKTEGFKFRTPFRRPFTNLFRLKYFPSLTWQVFYIAKKIKSPNEKIIIKLDDQIKEI